MLIYLAGAIDLVDSKGRHGWREKMKDELAARGMSSFDPSTAFRFIARNYDDAAKLIRINRKAMLDCDIVVMVMGKSMPSVGTPMELYMCMEANHPVVVVWEPDIKSFDGEEPDKERSPLPAYISGFIHTHGLKVFTRFDEVLDYLVEYNRSKIYSDTIKVSDLAITADRLAGATAITSSKGL